MFTTIQDLFKCISSLLTVQLWNGSCPYQQDPVQTSSKQTTRSLVGLWYSLCLKNNTANKQPDLLLACDTVSASRATQLGLIPTSPPPPLPPPPPPPQGFDQVKSYPILQCPPPRPPNHLPGTWCHRVSVGTGKSYQILQCHHPPPSHPPPGLTGWVLGLVSHTRYFSATPPPPFPPTRHLALQGKCWDWSVIPDTSVTPPPPPSHPPPDTWPYRVSAGTGQSYQILQSQGTFCILGVFLVSVIQCCCIWGVFLVSVIQCCCIWGVFLAVVFEVYFWFLWSSAVVFEVYFWFLWSSAVVFEVYFWFLWSSAVGSTVSEHTTACCGPWPTEHGWPPALESHKLLAPLNNPIPPWLVRILLFFVSTFFVPYCPIHLHVSHSPLWPVQLLNAQMWLLVQ